MGGPRRSELLLSSTLAALLFVSLTFSRPIFPLLATELGATKALIGVLTSLSHALPLLIAVPSGALLARTGIRKLAVAGSVCLVLGNAAYAGAGGLGLLAAARVLVGLAHVVVLVAVQTHIAELGRGGQGDRNFAVFFFCAGGGQLAGPLAAGLLASAHGIRATFWIAALIGLLPLALSFRLPGASAAAPAAAGIGANSGASPNPSPLSLAAVIRLLGLPGVRLGITASLVMLLAEGPRESYFPMWTQALGYDEAATGLFLSLGALFSILVQPFAGSLAARYGRARVLVAAMACGVLGNLMVPLVRSPLALGAGVALAGLGFGANQPPSMACVADSAPPEARGLAMALRLAGNRVGLLIGPLVAGMAVTAWGLAAYFLVSAGMLVAGGAYVAAVAGRGAPRGSRAALDG